MANAKKILITTESHETFTLRMHSRERAFGFCRSCEQNVEIVTLEQAVWMTQTPTRELLRMIDTQLIHATETDSGFILICVNSMGKEKAAARSSNEI